MAHVELSFVEPVIIGKNTDGVWHSTVGLEARKPGSPSRLMKTSVALKAATAGRMVLSAASRASPYAVALSAALEAYNYYFDADLGEIKASPTIISKSQFEKIDPSCQGNQVGCQIIDEKRVCGYTMYTEAMGVKTSCSLPLGKVGAVYLNNCTNLPVCDGRFPVKVLVPTSITSEKSPFPDSVSIPSSNEVSIDRIGDLFLNEQLPLFQKVVNDAINSGRYKEDWPELAQRLNEIKSSLDHMEYDSDSSTASKSAAVEQESGKSFCEWAPKICSLADFIMEPAAEPDIPKLPIQEVSPIEWNSGLPSGSCPTLPLIHFQGQSITYDLKDACWAAASVFKPILIALSLIGAAFILAGVRV